MSLHHRLRGSGSPSVVTSAYVGGTNNSSSGSSFTFTNHAIGTANANRRVVVIAYPNGSSVTNISGITIGGNAATEDIKRTNVNNGPVAIYSRAVASGTTATIVVSTNGNASRCRIEVFTVTGSAAVPTILDTGEVYAPSGTTASDTLTVAPDTAVVAGVGINSAAGVTVSWTNLTENSDTNSGVAARGMSTASSNIASGSSLTVTATISSTSEKQLLAAVYQ
ncbi:MAG: hypothetical protein WCY32_13870 [Burkholderiaceae bacterium]